MILLIPVIVAGCSMPTFYQRFYDFNHLVSDGNLAKAEEMLTRQAPRMQAGRLRFLYEVNAGLVLAMQGKFKESNAHFEQADLFVEDFRKNVLEEGSALLLNPNLTTYRGEDHEVLMINYYKALNYLQMYDYENALVEARRMNLRLQALSQKYQSGNKYKRDAFIHLLMGLIYDASGEYNNAFIAYRNALEIYEDDFSRLFNLPAPAQLQQDLVRTADLSGLYAERDRYIEQFQLNYTRPLPGQGWLVMLWNNGLGPVKVESGLNFTIVYGHDGRVTFVNREYGLSFPFYLDEEHDLNGLTWIKVVFPRYVERPEMFVRAELATQGRVYRFQKAEDINAISFKVLEERRVLELTKSLLRVALKQAAAAQAGKENEGLGTALSIIGSLTESADTRNWQTLPHSIYYTRVPLTAGNHELEMLLYSVNGQRLKHPVAVSVRPGQTKVYPINTMATTFHQLASYPY